MSGRIFSLVFSHIQNGKQHGSSIVVLSQENSINRPISTLPAQQYSPWCVDLLLFERDFQKHGSSGESINFSCHISTIWLMVAFLWQHQKRGLF
jgi:hypothetical protein